MLCFPATPGPFWLWSCSVAEDGPELLIFQVLPPLFWNYSLVPPCPWPLVCYTVRDGWSHGASRTALTLGKIRNCVFVCLFYAFRHLQLGAKHQEKEMWWATFSEKQLWVSMFLISLNSQVKVPVVTCACGRGQCSRFCPSGIPIP